MERKDFISLFGENFLSEYEYVNPLEQFEDYFFHKPAYGPIKNYRELALNKCIKEKVDFTSTHNSIYELTERLVVVKCPICNAEMEQRGGGGSRGFTSINYDCKCGTKISISLEDSAFNVEFKKED